MEKGYVIFYWNRPSHKARSLEQKVVLHNFIVEKH